VIVRLCSRCQSVLHREDEGSLVFCWNCGAPQVQLSEELRDQIDKQLAGTSVLDPLPLPSSPGNAIIWPGAIQCAGLAALLTAVLVLISFVLPPVALFFFFWLVGAPAFVLVIYTSRFRQSRITAGFGARLGVLSGLAIVLASVTLRILRLLSQRFLFHSSAQIDSQVADFFAQWQIAFIARSGTAAAAPIVSNLAIPEFREGLILGGFAIFLLCYLAFSATAGAFAGYVRSRSSSR